MDPLDHSQFIDLRGDEPLKDAHALAHSMAEAFVSDDCTAILRAFGLLDFPGGIS